VDQNQGVKAKARHAKVMAQAANKGGLHLSGLLLRTKKVVKEVLRQRDQNKISQKYSKGNELGTTAKNLGSVGGGGGGEA